RQPELTQQTGDFLARGEVTETRPRAKRCLVEIVQRGQSAREKFAIDNALGKTVDRAETHPERQLLEAAGKQLPVARSRHRKAVANNDPVGARAIELAPLAAGFPHHNGVVALASYRQRYRIEAAEHVEI